MKESLGYLKFSHMYLIKPMSVVYEEVYFKLQIGRG